MKASTSGIALWQFLGKSLGPCSLRHDDLLLLALAGLSAAVDGLMHSSNAFLLRHIDEGAGVDDQHVSQVGVWRHGHASLLQMADHHLRIDEILGATRGDETDFDHGLGRGRGARRRTRLSPTSKRLLEAGGSVPASDVRRRSPHW